MDMSVFKSDNTCKHILHITTGSWIHRNDQNFAETLALHKMEDRIFNSIEKSHAVLYQIRESKWRP